VLANALAAFGATMPSLDFAYNRARKVQFSFSNVTSTAVTPFDAGNYMTSGTLKTENPVVQHYFTGEDTQAFLIIDVLKSDSITITATDDHGVAVGVDVPAIQGMVGANIGVKASGSGNSTVTYSGTQPLTFGFIVDEIEFDGKKWSLSGAAPSGEIAFGVHAQAMQAQGKPMPILLGTGCMVDLF